MNSWLNEIKYISILIVGNICNKIIKRVINYNDTYNLAKKY
jgi:hypothetical protein